MSPHKINNHYAEAPTVPFPPYCALAPEKRNQLYGRLRGRLGLSPGTDELAILHAAIAAAGPPLEADADTPDFSLARLAATHGLDARARVVCDELNWHDTDEFLFADVCRFFDDIWYPSSDDLMILESDVRWFIFVRHDGAIQLKIFDGQHP